MTLQPADGAAIILHLIEAARALKAEPCPEDTEGWHRTVDLVEWVDALEARYAREQVPVEPVGWEPRRWRELVAGDRIEISGHEAVIEKAYDGVWHVDPRSNEYRPVALEQRYVSVKLVGRDPIYKMPPDGEVETLRGPAGAALDEANGYRSALAEEPIDIMASWAADAAMTLEAAGLGPIE